MASRDFSIFLLNPTFNHTNSLIPATKLKPEEQADGLPQGARLFIMDGVPSPPWWRSYFGIKREIMQVSKWCYSIHAS
jgi:hypothetical protein